MSVAAFVKHRPAGLLGRYVDSLWYRPRLPAGVDAAMLVLPAGRAEVVVNLGSAPQWCWTPGPGESPQRLHGVSVRPPTDAPVASVMNGREAAFGISFRPGGLRHFSRVALFELQSKSMPGLDLWGTSADDLLERLYLPGSPASMFARVESWLLKAYCEPHRAYHQVERAMAMLSDPMRSPGIEKVAYEVGLSPRRLLDLFHQDVGLAPKTYERVRRFSAALHLVRHGAPGRAGLAGNWADVAAACRYSDQAHLVREFHALAGMSPTRYLAQRTTGHANCLPLIGVPAMPDPSRPAEALLT